MRTLTPLLALTCAGLLAPLALAQDSVSKLSALPGDAINPHDAAEQINDYVVDLDAFRSSWGKVFAVGPIAKASQQRATAPTFYTALINAQALSRRVTPNVPFLRSTYAYWNAPGFGVNNNAARNDPPANLAPGAANGFQFGFGFQEFATGDPITTSLGIVTGGVAATRAGLPSRLFVSRVTAATNGTSEACSLGAFGMGAVDDSGNIHFRADGFGNAGPCGALNPFTGNNLFRVRMAQRTATLNALSTNFPLGAEAPPVTEHLLVESTTTHNVPNAIPTTLAGRPILIGSNFARQYVFEQVAGSVVAAAANAHLAGLPDHRGAVGYSMRSHPSLFPGAVNGTAAILSQTVSGSGALRDSVAIWGIAADGSLLSPISRTLPAPAAGLDPDQPAWAPTASQEFDHYHSQTAFQGGASQVALGGDQAGNLLVAGVVYYGFTPPSLTPFTNPRNYMMVARIDPLTGTTTWRAAAWTDGSTGKNVYQNGTTVIGNLRGFGAAPQTGPTMSAPMIDSVGNVWFVGSFERAANPGVTSVGLFRSVWSPAAGAFKLELVLAQGDVFRGPNSNLNYTVDFLTLNDADSISSGAAWSGNIAESAHLGMSTAGLATDDPRTLGGVIISASIVYDVNNDGMYVRSTGTGGTPGSPDEDYNVILYVAASADCNANGIADDRDILDGTATDTNGNGIPDTCEGIVGTLFCFGDGSGTPCPCANNSLPADQEGCLSSLGTGGRLRGMGVASITADTLVLSGTRMPSSSALYFQGLTQQNGGLGAVFGDGLRCAGGTVTRLGTKTNVAGASQYPAGADLPVSVRGGVTAPGTRTYQIWYRNAAAFCTAATFNLSNGIEINWTP